ncbi:MAG: hypothetical protein ACKVOM_07525 [Ferruginibacter sp.]
MENFTTNALNKFTGLMFFLKRSKADFEMVADEIENHSLKTALNNLSEESHYYASELKNYLKHLGVNSSTINEDNYSYSYEDGTASEIGNLQNGNELDCLCAFNEISLTQAYSDLLEEPLPCKSLQEIIMYQLNALKITFLKIRTLNTARFAMY